MVRASGLLGNLFMGPAAGAVVEALAGATGVVVVAGAPRLARAIAERGRAVVALSDEPRSLRKHRDPGAYASSAALPFADASIGAVVGVAPGDRWSELVAEWSRVVADGGAVVMVDRAPPTEASRRALCGGLMNIEQRTAGRTVVTSGQVAKLPGD